MTTTDDPPRGVDLAKVPDFALGSLEVSPSTARVRMGADERRVEPRVMQVLVVLARHAPRTVTRDELIDACWGGRIVSDDAVARVVAQVRALARGPGPPPFTLETIPKVGFRLVREEASAEGASPGVLAPGPRPLGRKRWVLVAGIASAVAVVAGGWGLWRVAGAGDANPAFGQIPRVDVMAFDARRPDPELRRLSEALSESVVRRLSRGGGLRTSERPLQPDSGGGDAEFRLVGALDRQGSDILMDGQLIDRRSGLVLWSAHEHGPAPLGDDHVQTFAGVIAATVQCALEDRRISRAAMSPTALGLYLSTCDAVINGQNPVRAVAVGRRLVAAGPRLAGAHAMLSIANAMNGEREDRAPAEAAADRAAGLAEALAALRIDPRTPKAYLGREMSRGPGAWLARETDLKAALSLDPDLPPPQIRYASLLREVGRLRDGLSLAAATAALDDPRAGDTAHVRLAMMRAASGDLAGADAQIDALGEATDVARFLRWTIAFFWRDPKEALVLLRKPGEGPRDPTTRACAERYLSALVAGGVNRGLPAECAHVEPSWRLRLLAREGDLDAAYASLRPSLSRGQITQLFFVDMKRFRADPRFMPLAKRLGLVDYWRQSGRWPDFCLALDRPYDCEATARAL